LVKEAFRFRFRAAKFAGLKLPFGAFRGVGVNLRLLANDLI